VVWRSAGPNVGWMPMPPDDGFLGAAGPDVSASLNFGDWNDTSGFYGYTRWYGPRFDENRFGALWTFVPTAHVADPVYRNYVVPRPQVVNIVRVSRNITNYTTVNNVIINRSVNITMVQGAGGKPVVPVHAAAVLHNSRWIMPVDRGRQVQAQMRQIHPRGNGVANSAPKPTAQQIHGLSTRPVPVRGSAGGAPHHLFSQADAAQIRTGRPAPNAAAPAPQRPPALPAGNVPQPPPRQTEPREQTGHAPVPLADRPEHGRPLRDNMAPSRAAPEKPGSPPPRPAPGEMRPSHPETTRQEPPHRAAPPPKVAQHRPADPAAPKPEHRDDHHETDH
jgi:hypothetical protein